MVWIDRKEPTYVSSSRASQKKSFTVTIEMAMGVSIEVLHTQAFSVQLNGTASLFGLCFNDWRLIESIEVSLQVK